MDRGALTAIIVPLIALAGMAATTELMISPPWTAMRVAGLVLLVFGFTLLTVARIQLGNAFSVTAQARVLVTRGLYRRFRNPIYVFSTLALAGVALYVDQPWALLALLVIVPVQVSRARRERRVLEEKFGDEYRAYARGTWF